MAKSKKSEVRSQKSAVLAKNKSEPRRDVEKHRQCPICFPRFGGAGVAYCTRGRTRYYKCDRCGHTWTAVVEVEVTRVEHRDVELDER